MATTTPPRKLHGMTQNFDRDAVVRQVLEEHLASAKIVDLLVKEGKDADGDPILDITVVFEAEDDRLDPDQVLGLIRHLRRPLNEIGSDLFPILWFKTREEAADATA